MSARDGLRKGWCPGALRPMRTGDGLLVRLRLSGGIVPPALARALAECAREFGNGLVDHSARANLQLRGVTEDSLPALTERLNSLGVLDDDAEAEAVRNVIAGPLAGLDPAAVLDIRPVVAALEARLKADRALHALPGKFGFLVDDGGTARLDGVNADIRFEAFRRDDGTAAFAVKAAGESEPHPVAVCRPADVPDVAASLGKTFLALAGEVRPQARRMARLADALGPVALAASAGLVRRAAPARPDVPAPARRPGAWRTGDLAVLGVAAPFGTWTADALAVLADCAERHGNGELRLTPWRLVLLPGVADPVALSGVADLIIDPEDPRLSVAACAGMPGCASATVRTRPDAADLAGLARSLSASGVGLHVSGCRKGCAHPGVAPATLVGRDGLYDVVLGGSADGVPAAQGLTAGAAAQFIARAAGGGQGGRPA
jgi:precorrin-3B synthase